MKCIRTSLALLFGALLLLPPPALGQSFDGGRAAVTLGIHGHPSTAFEHAPSLKHLNPGLAPSYSNRSRSSFLLGLAGAGGFVAGLSIGTLVGYAMDHDFGDSWVPLTTEIVIGAVAGGSLGAPLAVHLANRRQGNLVLAVLASGASSLAYVPLLERLHPGLLLLPLGQIVVSVAIERLTSR